MSRFTHFSSGKILDVRKIAGVKDMTHIMSGTCCNIGNCMLCNVYWICCTSIELDMTVSTVILTHRIDSVQCSLYQYDHLSNENCYYGSVRKSDGGNT